MKPSLLGRLYIFFNVNSFFDECILNHLICFHIKLFRRCSGRELTSHRLGSSDIDQDIFSGGGGDKHVKSSAGILFPTGDTCNTIAISFLSRRTLGMACGRKQV